MKKKILLVGIIIMISILLPYMLSVLIEDVQQEAEQMSFDEYGIQILASEVSPDFEYEMLKVQAVLVRTSMYLELHENEGKLKSDLPELFYDIPDDFRKDLEKAWKETEGEIILYEDAIALVPFHQLSNGKTRSGKKALDSKDYAYLKSVECPKDVEAEEQLKSEFVDVTNATILAVDESNYVTEVKVGDKTYTGEQFRDLYQLASSSFSLQQAEGKMRITTYGIGHGIGISQHTANEMAKDGKEYQEILQYFLKNIKIEKME